MNARKVVPTLTAALLLLAGASGSLLAQTSCLTVGQLGVNCYEDEAGKPIYAFYTEVTHALTCSPLTLTVAPYAGTGGTVQPSSFSLTSSAGTGEYIFFALFNPLNPSLAAFSYSLNACGQTCSTVNREPLPTQCGTCLTLADAFARCKSRDGNLCTYEYSNHVHAPDLVGPPDLPATLHVQYSAGSGTASFPDISGPLDAVSGQLTVPCDVTKVTLTEKLAIGGETAPRLCKATIDMRLTPCPPGPCDVKAVPQDAKLCAPGSTRIDLQPTPNVPAGAVTWYSTTDCATTIPPPTTPPWQTLSGGTSWYTLGLSQTTCYQALIQGMEGCPSPVKSTVAKVQVVQPASPGPLQCTLQGGGACPPKMCAPAKISLQTSLLRGCTRTWEQDLGSGWQPVSGAIGLSYDPPPLNAATCPSSTARFRATASCEPCAARSAEAAFEIFRPSAAGTLAAVKPQICAGDDDVVNLAGACGDSIQWQISTNGTTWSNIPGALGPTTWLTNKLFQNTWYRVQVANGPCAAAVSAPVKITVKPKPTVTLSASGPTQVCAPAGVVLNASGTPAGGTYQWFKDGLPVTASGQTFTAKQSGNYWVVYSTGCGKVKSNPIKVFVSKVTAAIEGPCGVCPPQCISLKGIAAGGKPGYTYAWTWMPGNGSSSGQTLNQCPTVPTTYTLTVKDDLGCKAKAVHKVGICPRFTANAGTDRKIPKGTSTLLGGSPTADGGQPPYLYAWTPAAGLDNPAAANPKAAPKASTTYTVTVTDAKGCKATAQVKVLVK